MRAFPAFNDEPIPDSIPLTSWEKVRRAELEQVVRGGLAKFLEVGIALAELRNRRLYRTEFATFEHYVLTQFGLHRAAVDGVIRSAQTAQVLLDAGLELPPDTNPTSLRAISALPGDELKTACWQLAERLSPARVPSQPLVSKLCRLVRHCLEDTDPSAQADENGGYDEPRHSAGYHRPALESPERETPFVRPVLRLATWSGFSAELVVSHIAESSNARTLFSACGAMIGRCQQIQERLKSRFPDMEGRLVEHHPR